MDPPDNPHAYGNIQLSGSCSAVLGDTVNSSYPHYHSISIPVAQGQTHLDGTKFRPSMTLDELDESFLQGASLHAGDVTEEHITHYKSLLSKPQSSNTTKLQYVCAKPGCSKKFSKSAELRKHEARHARKYFCTFDYCYKRFGTKWEWKRHEKSQHLQPRAFRCRGSVDSRYCNLYCEDEDTFRRHVLREHPAAPMNPEVFMSCQLDENWDGNYWCGFCNEICQNTRLLGISALQARYEHISHHIDTKDAKLGFETWVELRGGGKTKAYAQYVSRITEEINKDVPDHPNSPGSLSSSAQSLESPSENEDQDYNEDENTDDLQTTDYLLNGIPAPLSNLTQDRDSNGLAYEPVRVAASRSHYFTDSGYASGIPKDAHQRTTTPTNLEEVRTAYTASNAGTVFRESFAQLFVQFVLKDLKIAETIDHRTIERLDDILAEFAARLGQGKCQPVMARAIRFIHKYRDVIRRQIKSIIQNPSLEDESEDEDSFEDRRRQNESLNDKMSRFFMADDISGAFEAMGVLEAEEPIDTDDLDPVDDMELKDVPEFERYAANVRCHPAYMWLLDQLQPKISVDLAHSQAFRAIETAMLTSLPKLSVVHRNQGPDMLRAEIAVDWCPYTFIKQQGCNTNTSAMPLSDFVTLTGSVSQAQALSCIDYIGQVWSDNGCLLLNILNDCMSGDLLKRKCYRPDGAELSILQLSPNLVVEVSGSRGSIIEVAQLLAWLGAALNTHTDAESGYATLSQIEPAVIEVQSMLHEPECRSPGCVSLRCSNECLRKFSIKFRNQLQGNPGEDGTCWLPLLSGMSIVSGFPVPTRTLGLPGLELPFDLMAVLVGCEYIQKYADQIYIRGSSAMLVPALLTDDGVLVWHLCADEFGQNLSYLDHNVNTVKGIDVQELIKYRNIVGWCDSAMLLTGTALCDYLLKRGRLPRTKLANGLEDSTISGPYHIRQTSHFKVPERCTSIHMRQIGVSSVIKQLSKQFFLLWDTSARRGWLVDGTAALLHLLRTSLKLEERDSDDSNFLLDLLELDEPELPYDVGSAKKFLFNRTNMARRISRAFHSPQSEEGESRDENQSFESLGDRVKQLHILLEQAISYQEAARRRNRVSKLPSLPLKYLEGWDFVHLAEQQNDIDPCVTILASAGETWARFVRSTGIVTLFADGFGDLIKPDVDVCCGVWKSVPINRYYIAVGKADMNRMIDYHGNPDRSPCWLSVEPPLIWHRSSATDCGCLVGSRTNCNDAFVQTAWPYKDRKVLPKHNHTLDSGRNDQGAIVFGHNTSVGYHLTHDGPKEGIPSFDVNEDELEELFIDEGLGTSLQTTRSAELISPPTFLTPSTAEGNQYTHTSMAGSSSALFGNIYYSNHSCDQGQRSQPSSIIEFVSNDVLGRVSGALPSLSKKRFYEASAEVDRSRAETALIETESVDERPKRQR